MLDLKTIDSGWTLFLDRDGVINHEKEEDYIYHYQEFVFYAGVLKAMKIFHQIFGKIILVTNQRGVGKQWMTEADLHAIHQQMQRDIEAEGGRIDAIYYSTSLDNAHPFRKPQAGMALKAQSDFPVIDFKRSIMVGNNISDMEFGRNAGMYTVFLTTTRPATAFPQPAIDFKFNSLLNFAEALTKP